MTDEKMTAGQYYLARIGTAVSDMQTTLNALREAREAELAEGLKERVRGTLEQFGIGVVPEPSRPLVQIQAFAPTEGDRYVFT